MSVLHDRTLPETDTMYPIRKIDFILHAAQRLASSYGLQPLKIFLVKDADVLSVLKKDAPVIVFAVWRTIGEEKINAYIHSVAVAKKVTPSSLRKDRKGIIRAISRLNEEGGRWAARQAELAVNNVLAAAKEVKATVYAEEVDVVAVNALLGLTQQGLTAVQLVSLHFDLTTHVSSQEHFFTRQSLPVLV